ncbi:AAA domain-containing protein [Aphelenchoides bicaudatus]|nr:AAA domain-containing protein [Aphelenchoides bicaudatus]
MDKKNCLPESPVSKKIRFAEDDESIINFKEIMSMRASRPKNQQRAKNVVNSGQVRTYQQSITSFFTGTSDNAFKNRPTVRRGAKSQQIHSDSPTPVFIPAKMGLSKSDRTLFENNHYQEAQSKDVETLPETEEDKKRAVLIKGVNKDFAEEILSAMISTSGIRMADILGNEDAKRALEEAVVLPTLNPSLFSGLREPRKGHLTFWTAWKRKDNACDISSATIMSKWVGDAERMMQALFQVARNAQPSIIFIDEVDSLLSERKENENGAARRVKTEFLLQFDGCSSRSDDRILVLGATNRPQELDDAIMRRFPRRIYINLPNEKARIDLIKNNFARTNTRMNTTDEQIEAIARKCTNYSFSDLSALCREAAMFPLRSLSREQLKTATLDDLRPITYSDLLEASELVRASTNPENVRRLEDYAERFA